MYRGDHIYADKLGGKLERGKKNFNYQHVLP